MALSLISCPSCNTMLLSDTDQCPTCGHVVDEMRSGSLERQQASQSAQQDAVPIEEEPCPNCAEMVRVGLVRCWNCGSFMRGDIAEAYQRMQRSPTPVIYSDLPVADDVSSGGLSFGLESGENDLYAQDGDFRLSPEFETRRSRSEPDSQTAAEQPAAAAAPPPKGETAPPETGQQQAADRPAGEAPPETDLPHSVATGGDVLLQVALQEEAEEKRKKGRGRRRRGQAPAGGVRVYCPNGHRIVVQEKHRGLTGRCPRCKSPFYVPQTAWDEKPADEQTAATEGEQAAAEDRAAAGRFGHWLEDVHVHTLSRQKLERLKLKEGSLKGDFLEFDLGFGEEGMLAAMLVKKGGLFGPSGKKGPRREELRQHIQEDRPLDDLPVAEHRLVPAERLQEARVVQPAVYAHESMFAGVPVFGEGLIAVRIPPAEGEEETRFLSLPLSQFRNFAKVMDELYGVKDFGGESGVPLEDSFVERKCHFSEQALHILEDAGFYQADPACEPKLIGWQCAGCELVVSEESRRKEKIGGLAGKTIAKARCPKCGKLFGKHPLYTLEQPEQPEQSAASHESGDSARGADGGMKAEDSKVASETKSGSSGAAAGQAAETAAVKS